MSETPFIVRQLIDEIQPPESGKTSVALVDDEKAKVMVFAFAAGSGLAEHVAPFPAIIQIVQGNAALTVGDESVAGQPGTWIQMARGTPHSIQAETPVVTLLK